jgi:hypothetical protein
MKQNKRREQLNTTIDVVVDQPGRPTRMNPSVREKSKRAKLQQQYNLSKSKFLVANDGWRLSAVRSVSIRDVRSLYTKTARCGFG